MKKFIILLFFAAGAWVASAQSFNFGIKAGINMSSLSTKFSGVSEGDKQIGFVGGAFARVGILGFYVEPNLLYSQRVGELKGNGQTSTIHLDYLDIPVMLGYKFLIARIYVGPNFQFLLNASQTGAKTPAFGKDAYNTSTVGYQAGVGVDLSRFTIDLRYDGCFSDLGKEVTDDVTGTKINYSTQASMWQLTLGYKFIKL